MIKFSKRFHFPDVCVYEDCTEWSRLRNLLNNFVLMWLVCFFFCGIIVTWNNFFMRNLRVWFLYVKMFKPQLILCSSGFGYDINFLSKWCKLYIFVSVIINMKHDFSNYELFFSSNTKMFDFFFVSNQNHNVYWKYFQKDNTL